MTHASLQPRFSHPRATGVLSTANGAPTIGDTLDMMGAPILYERNAEIFGEGEPAEYVHKVLRGAVRTYRLLNDGRRQIGGFYLPGDAFGLEVGLQHRITAEAIVASSILVVKRDAVVALAHRDAGVARELWAMTAAQLAQAQDLMLTLGRKNAQERLAAFLLELAARTDNDDAVELPMPRQDIADYLGLTIETVSRTLTQLEHESAIALPSSRRIVLRDRAALDRLNA